MPTEIERFIENWRGRTGKETGNLQPFLLDLCVALGLPRPGVSAPGAEYCFEYSVGTVNEDGTTATDEIDLYRRGCFILEGKQTTESVRRTAGAPHGSKAPSAPQAPGAPQAPRAAGAAKQPVSAPALPLSGPEGGATMTTYDRAVARAFGQAVRYAKDLALRGEQVPFLVVCDVGVGFYVWNRFSGDYGRYASRRVVALEELSRGDVQDYLRAIWLSPASLDQNAVTAAVTREIAEGLGGLKQQLAAAGQDPRRVALFLMRVVFTFFAESMGLLPRGLFTAGLAVWEQEPEQFQQGISDFWAVMNQGGRFGHDRLKRFNGGLFRDVEGLPLTKAQIGWTRRIAEKSWKDIDPAIFGALLEGALDPDTRKKYGIHYTPRAHIQRLVDATFGEDLWAEWTELHAKAHALLDGEPGEKDASDMKAALLGFRQKLGRLVILDPACGSGNFLYVAFDTLKRIEEEVIATLAFFGETKKAVQAAGEAITPATLLGMEIDGWAASIAELVLWIAYIQWYCRLYPQSLSYGPIPEPVLQNYGGIEQRDAVLEWSATKETGRTRWGGRMVKSPRTGRPVPDPADQVPILAYTDPRQAEWPKADYIVGNPPFLGNSKQREVLGDGYAEALRAAYPQVPDTVDLVMYWWHRAALEVRSGRAKRFGLITTGSIKQVRQSRLIAGHIAGHVEGHIKGHGGHGGRGAGAEEALPPLKLLWAVPDHPWGGTTAKVRIAMTVGGLRGSPRIAWVRAEGGGATPEERASSVVLDWKAVAAIHADLGTTAAAEPAPLRANAGLCSTGVKLHGDGFIVGEDKWKEWGRPDFVKPYVIGRDLAGQARELYVIDLFGLEEAEVKSRHPDVYQHLLDRVKPERDQSNDPETKAGWWIFGRPRPELRQALKGLKRYIATPETPKHRAFVFLDAGVVPESKVIAVASDDAFHLGVLSSRIHRVWCDARCRRLGTAKVYAKPLCFDPFPFPDPPDAVAAEIRALGEELDGLLKGAHLRFATITQVYNVVELTRAGAELGMAHRFTRERAGTDYLMGLHERLDAAVARAYGWPADLTDGEILGRLTSLNAERAAEEAAGRVRWLRPDYQQRLGGAAPKERARTDADTWTDTDTDTNANASAAAPPRAAAARAAGPAPLKANAGLCSQGFKLHGDGFIVGEDKWKEWGRPSFVKPYVNGNDVVARPRGLYVIDLFGLEEAEVKRRHPHVYQYLLDRVKPERDQNNRRQYRDNWWIFGEPRPELRQALDGLKRYIATTETAKHRTFVFLDAGVASGSRLMVIASDDAFHLGVLSSKIHSVWFDARCGHLETRRVYTKSLCFDPFPFPDPPGAVAAEIRALGEELDGHIKGAQLRGATITQIYNVVDVVRSGAPLAAEQRPTHETAATDVLMEIHDRLDAAVARAYGWPAGMAGGEMLERLTALNAERAREEAAGKVRWLRPDWPAGGKAGMGR